MTAKNYFSKIYLAAALLLGSSMYANAYNGTWHTVSQDNVPASGVRSLQPDKYLVFQMNVNSFTAALATVNEDPEQARVFELPVPGGGFRSFKVWQTATMAPELAAKYPQIKTFNAVAVDNANVTAKLDYTIYGFHAMVYDGSNTYFIDPYSNVSDGYYLCYYKHDYTKRTSGFVPCGVKDREDELGQSSMQLGNENPQLALLNGITKRTYRLALACTQEYANVVTSGNPTKPGVLSAMTTTMNRVNGVYEKDMSVTMQLIANNDDIIYLAEPDPYTSGSQKENQDNITPTIGAANYDIGHLFKKSLGGISDLGCVCNDTRKARSVTGQPNPVGDPFDLDYVAHEIGHQFGAEHTFNASTGSCTGNGVADRAYEPGSGSTLMAYAGICDETNVDNNVAKNSSAYFHAASLEQIIEFTTIGIGATCGATAASGNTPVIVPPFAQDRDIPKQTPFELEAPQATDADHQSLTYCWEEWDLDNFGADFFATTTGPIFRSFDPTDSRWRVFPTLEKLLNNTNSYLGEKLPDVGRDMIFKLAVRDVLNGFGVVNFPDDEVTLHVDANSGPFLVTTPNTNADYWQMGTQQTVNWDVANTTASPVNCQDVEIMLSLDGGYTYTSLISSTPNDGSETITVPNTPTASARVKVKGVNNVFFDISNQNFKINSWPANVKDVNAVADVNIYPVPAINVLHVEMKSNKQYEIAVTNAIGQSIWNGNMAKQTAINVDGWAKGMYQLQLSDMLTNEKTVKKFLVQ